MDVLRTIGSVVLAAFALALGGHAQDAELGQRFERLANYASGATRVDLIALERAARGAGEERRAELERRYVDLLHGEHTDAARTFALRQLVLVGSESCVPTLGRAFAHPEDVHLACNALAAIGGDAARAVAVQAVGSPGELNFEVVRLLGDLGAMPSLLAIARDANRPDEERVAALEQLARFDDDAARSQLLNSFAAWSARADRRDGSGAATARLAQALLSAADRVLANGDLGPDDEDFVVGACTAVERSASGCVESRAFVLRARVEGAAMWSRALLLLSDPDADADRRDTGVRILVESRDPAVVPFLCNAVPELGPVARDLVARVFLERRDPAAVEALVRIASLTAIEALAAIGGEEGFDALLSFVLPDAAVVDREPDPVGRAKSTAALAGLARSSGAWVTQRVRERLTDPDLDRGETSKLLNVLARRDGDGGFDTFAIFAERPDTAEEAWGLIERYARGERIDAVVASIRTNAVAPSAAGAALDALLRRSSDPASHSDGVLATYDAAGTKVRRALLPALAVIGTDAALQSVRTAVSDTDLALAAVDALGRWPNAAAFEALMVAYTTGSEALRPHAFEAILQLGGRLAANEPANAGGVVRGLWGTVRSEEERARVLALAGRVPSRAAAEVVQLAFLDGVATAAAIDAAVELAPRLDPDQRYVALELLELARTRVSTADDTRALVAAIDAVEADEDFLLAWRLAGPYDREGVQGSELMELVFPPETDPDDPAIQWRDLWPQSAGAQRGIFDLNAVLAGSNATAYLRTQVWSDTEQRVRLELGSDDGLCVWLNGTEIHRNDVMRGLTVGSDVVLATLRAGWNDLVLEVTQGGGDWSFCCRLRGVDRRAASGWHADRIRRRTAAPPDSVVLLGPGAEGATEWRHADGSDARWSFADGVLAGAPGTGNLQSRFEFRDATVHVEFRVPHEPKAERGQGQGNSGVYLQGRYEVQILDSWGLAPHPNECGSIYGVRAPNVNMSARPGEWQAYDIEFTAPRWDDGEKVSNARMTVFHDGVLIHDDVEILGPTGAGGPELEGPGPLVLQDHGHEVEFRNVWVWQHAGPTTLDPRELVVGDGLDGWIQRGGEASYVRDGDAIVGTTRPDQPNAFLCTEADYGDFVLEYEFLVDDELNSGVQIRSQSRPEHLDGRVHGYQVEIDPSERGWTGGIYDEARRGWLAPLEDLPAARAAFRHGEWNRVRVVAHDDVLRTWLNGQPCAVLVDAMSLEGFIGLQVHGVGGREEPLEVRWRGLRLLGF